MLLAKIRDLDHWAKQRDAQALLPRIIRQLIHATVSQIERIGFPAEEGIQSVGWDGIVMAGEGTAFVPKGLSVWELSTNGESKRKADEDYEKRSKPSKDISHREAVFIFVTPRSWSGKKKWELARKKEGLWRDVRAYDADDLEQWLERAPSVHLWVSNLIGKSPVGATDLENLWIDWSQVTKPHIQPTVLLAGRQEIVDRIYEWLAEPQSGKTFTLQADTSEEAVAFFAATIFQLPDMERDAILARSVVVYNPTDWDLLSASNERMLLIPTFEIQDRLGRANRKGHNVLLPLDNSYPKSSNTNRIPRISRAQAKTALMEMGFDDERAENYARLARRSLTALRRKLAQNPEVQRPQWARPNVARTILPAMFIGSWSDSNSADQEILATLSGKSYEELRSDLVRWCNESDPPVRRTGDTWFITSKDDTWVLLSRFVGNTDIGDFEKICLKVLGEIDPSIDLPEQQRWTSALYGKVLKHSHFIREGIADTLALMGTLSELVTYSDSANGQEWANRIVRKLLAQANDDKRLWMSLSTYLRSLAEAAPRVFLEAIEKDLSGNDPVIVNLFAEEDTPFGSSPHTGLLWALEVLAWNPEFLGHASLLLAKLARLDPGGRLTNRPINSLVQIFLFWHPHTKATYENRMNVLDSIRRLQPDIAWSLLIRLLPKLHGSTLRTAEPRWRDWSIEAYVPETLDEVWDEVQKSSREVTKRLLNDVEFDGRRWKELILCLSDLPVEDRKTIVDVLFSQEPEKFGKEDRLKITDALRLTISRHREFCETGWALPEDEINYLEKIHRNFMPDDPISQNKWLFSNRTWMLQPSQMDWQDNQRKILDLRRIAVEEVWNQGGLNALLKLGRSVEVPYHVGVAYGSNLALAKEDYFLDEELVSTEIYRLQIARGFIEGQFKQYSWPWVENIIESSHFGSWGPAQKAELFICLPFDVQTWDRLESMDSLTQQIYWTKVQPFGIATLSSCERVVLKLLEYDRAYIAADLLVHHSYRKDTLPFSLVVSVLEHAAMMSPIGQIDIPSAAHNISRLMDFIEKSGEIEADKMAGLEWKFLPLLAVENRASKVLHRALSNDPNFYLEMLNMVYRSRRDEPSDSYHDESIRAQQGAELLHGWRLLPGLQEDGSVNSEFLKTWVRQVREKTKLLDYGSISDHYIGKILAFAPKDNDGAWPHSAVRDLIEELASETIEEEIEVGLFNQRGVVMKGLTEGGEQEREIARRYEGFASLVRDFWPRTGALLTRISENYISMAHNADLRAEISEDFLR
jgi:hypothetical protein